MTSVMRLVAQERLERPEADDLVGDLLEHPDALGTGQGEAFLVDDLAEDLLDLAPDLDLVGQVELRVEVLDDPLLDAELDVPERLADRRLAGQPAPARRRSAACHRPAPATGRTRARPEPGSGRLPVERSRSASAATSPTPLLAPRGCFVTCSAPCEQRFLLRRPCGCSSAAASRPLADHRPGQPEDVLADLRLPVATGRTVRHGSRRTPRCDRR